MSARIAVEQRRDRVVELTLAGLTAHRIAARLEVSARTIERDRAARGVTLPPMECRGGRYQLGCRCDLCRQRNAEHVKRVRARRRERGAVPPVHGASGYCNYDCRCDVCSAAHSARCKAYQARRRELVSA